MRHLIYFLFFILVAIACKTSKFTATPAQMEALENLIINKDFVIESNWAYPQSTNAMQQIANTGILGPGNTAGSINLIGNSNFLKISGDSIMSYLPYYGERQMNVGYGGSDSAIQLKDIVHDYKVKTNKDNSYTITLNANSKTENFTVYLRVFPNLKSSITFNSPSRFPIRYEGKIQEKITTE
ncbi:DUF4251 domain-containing protein [uncultured Algibacter sp.]|uniref:DUF4251 domain-containing protein n=1 Tax=uncultured Algibacter sp. TaxID=298659 RepID=UPI0026193D4E|nr:DUF4251 domain-containing protein [uncultured Algibacter sp.]